MSPSRKAVHSALRSAVVETLEERRLMAAAPWGQQAIVTGQDLAATNYSNLTGAGTSIAIIDTGIDYRHPSLGGGFGAGHKVVAGWDFVDNDADPMDADGHGTGVAGTAAGLGYDYGGRHYQGVAPGANLIALRTDPGTYGWAKSSPLVKEALQWVIDHRDQYNIVAVNMSLGRGHYTDEPQDSGVGTEYGAELAQLKAMGVVLVASSGNNGVQTPLGIEYPAAHPDVYAIGAVDPTNAPNDVIWTSTERGPFMDLLAPGANVTLPYYNASTGQHIYVSGANGTSFATPWAAGMAALMKQLDPTLTPDEAMSIMKRSGVAKYDSATGLTWPRINVNNALAMTWAERDDAMENNDSAGGAKALSFSGGNTASVDDLRSLVGDPDWFKFTLGQMADIDWALTVNGGGSNPVVDLIDANGTVVKRLAATDQIRLAAGTYFVRVNAPAASLEGTYGFSLSQTPDDAADNHTTATATPIALDSSGQGSVADMVLLSNVPDYYSFTLAGTRDVNLSIEYGGASAIPGGQLLMDTDGNVIATFDADGTLSRRLAAGRYLIRVASSAATEGTYGVSVRAAVVAAPPTPGANGSSNGIAYDSAGRLHFAYYDESTSNLKYAVRSAAGTWSGVTVVDGGTMAGQFVSLALDSLGRPAIAYYDASQGDLKYAQFNGSSWSVQTVDSRLTTGYYPSLQFGGGDRPVISYYFKNGGDLKLASWNGGGWTIGAIDTAGDVGRYSSLAVNLATGRWAVAYEDTGHGSFKYAEQGKATWTAVTVDASTRMGGGYISLAFSPKTKLPAMSYYDAYNANLKFAGYTGSRWVSEAVAVKGTVGLYSNLRIDAATGLADILYYNKGSDTVLRARPASGTWSLTPVVGTGGRWISRALDAAGDETLAYVNGSGLEVVDL